MLTTIRAAAIALAMMAAASLGSAATAQTPEAEALGAQVAHVMFASIGFKDVVAKEMQKAGGGLDIKSRPEWDGLAGEAVTEEVTAQLPAIEQMVGRAFAKKFTVPEMKTGLVVLSDPNVQADVAAGAQDRPASGKPPGPVALRAAASRDGQAFLSKFGDMDAMLGPLEDEFLVQIMPGMLRRMADKIDAYERTRAAKR